MSSMAFDNGLREINQPVTVTSLKKRRKAETDGSSKSAVADEVENCCTSSCIFSNTFTYKASVLRDITAPRLDCFVRAQAGELAT